MSILSPPTGVGLSPPSLPMRRFTVDEYHRMIQAGILTEEDRVELLEGWIVHKMPHNPPHDGTIEVVDDRLRGVLPPGWRIRVQSAITTSDSEPEPDIAVVRGTARTYLARHPGPTDVGLLVEVSDSTLSRDRGEKGRLFARAGIVRYWIVNLIDRQIEVYSEPTGPTLDPSYGRREDYRPGVEVPVVLDGVEIARIPVNELLP